MMSTPSDFFTSNDDNDPHRDTATPSAGTDADAPVDEGQHRQPQPGDSGPVHRAAPQAGERWQPPQPPQPPQRQASAPQSGPIPRVPPANPHAPQAPYQSGPPQAPYQPAPTQRPSGLQPTPPPYGAMPPLGAPQPGPAAQPPTGEPRNNSGQHRLAQQGYVFSTPPQPSRPPHDPSAPRADRRVDDDEFDPEKTTTYAPEVIAQAIEMSGVGEFFETPAPGAAPQQQPQTPSSPGLLGGSMGSGEPFNPVGYVSGSDPAQIVSLNRHIDLTGWRKAVSVMSFGLIKPGPSAKQVEADELIRSIRASLVDVFVVAFANSKGGVGKTTMAVAVGNAIARERGDRVVVVDVDTDQGTLSDRFYEHGGATANIQAFAAMKKDATGVYSMIRRYTVQNDDRLEMLSSQNNPASDYRLTTGDFETTMKTLRSHYNVIILDCGTAITAPLFQAIAKQINCLVVVASQNRDGVNGAGRTHQYLAAHGMGHLLPKTVVVLNKESPQKPKVDIEDAATQFREKATANVLMVPFDDHLDEGGAIEFTRMKKKTQKAVMKVAGTIAHFYPTRQQPQADGMGGY